MNKYFKLIFLLLFVFCLFPLPCYLQVDTSQRNPHSPRQLGMPQLGVPSPQDRIREVRNMISFGFTRINPPQAHPGDIIAAYFWVRNRYHRSVSLKLAIYINNSFKRSCDLTVEADSQLNSLISAPAPAVVGSCKVELKLLSPEANPQHPRSSDIIARQFKYISVIEALPDLVVMDFQVREPSLRIEHERNKYFLDFPFQIKVRNIGEKSANNFYVRVEQVDSSSNVMGYPFIGKVKRELFPNQNAEFSGSFSVPLRLIDEGIFRFRVKVDCGANVEFATFEGDIREKNENNNYSPIVEKTANFVYLEKGPYGDDTYYVYRGDVIKVKGKFSSAPSDIRIAFYRGGVRITTSQIIEKQDDYIVFKIRKVRNITAGEKLRFFVEDFSGRIISNYCTIYIKHTPTIDNVTTFYISDTYLSDILSPNFTILNHKPFRIIASLDEKCEKVNWAFGNSKTELVTPFVENLYGEVNLEMGNDRVQEYYLILKDVSPKYRSYLYDDSDSEGVVMSSEKVKIYNVFKESFRGGLVRFAIPSITIHIDKDGSYMEIKKLHGKLSIPLDIPHSFTVEVSGASDMEIMIQDLNCYYVPAREPEHFEIEGDKAIMRFIFETEGPDEIRIDKVTPYSPIPAWYPDVDLHEFKITIEFKLGYPHALLCAHNFIHDIKIKVDLDADIEWVPDVVLEHFIGDIDPKIKMFVGDSLYSALRDTRTKEVMYQMIMNEINSYLPEGCTILFAYLKDSQLFVEYILV